MSQIVLAAALRTMSPSAQAGKLMPLTHSSSPGEVGKLMGVSMRSARPILGEHCACACQAAQSSVHDMGPHSSELEVLFAKENSMPCRTRKRS